MPRELKYENDISPNKEYQKINRNYKRNKIEIIKLFKKITRRAQKQYRMGRKKDL